MKVGATARSGFTLVQVVIAMGLMGLGLQSIFMVMDTTGGAVKTNMIVVELDSKGQTAIQKIKMVLRASQMTGVTPIISSPFSANRIDFQRAIGVNAGATVWSPLERIQQQYAPGEVDDGVDNDGNGLIDDCHIVWIQDVGGPNQRTQILATNVSEFLEGELPNAADDNGNVLRDERGLSFDYAGSLVNLQLTVGKVDTGGVLIERTFQVAIQIRN